MLERLRELTSRLDDVMLCDRHRVRRRARFIESAVRDAGGRHTREAGEMLERLEGEIARSVDRRRRRAGGLPKPAYPPELPVSARREEIARAIAANQVVVVCGETGSGKTTQLPKICLELGRGVAGMIGHTQPRRIAARAVAARIAEELGSPLGRDVGYKVRFGDKTSPETFVKVMTDGILLAETQGDRFLEQYDTIIIDEAHERSLNVDFLLGYLRQLLPKRPELKVIVTSATIDPQRFAAHFAGPRGPAPIVEVSGRTYPVDVHYRPAAHEEDADERDMEDAILAAVDELASCGPGDILVFLSGEREIRQIAEALRKHHPPSTEILPLYARLSAEEQMRVFKPHSGRRIVLATNVAETSLTVPGILYVVDPGFARISRYGHRTKVQRLPIEPISRASADQRKGRCGRIAPGVCVRLYEESDYLSRPQFTDPEILRTNLASVILQMKSLRLGPPGEFPFIDAPEPKMLRDGYETLHELGAIDEAGGVGNLTRLGAQLAKLPIDPRIGRMVLAAREENCLREVLVIAAALSIQDPRERPMNAQDAADQAHRRFQHEESDFLGLLNLWTFFAEQAEHLSQSKLRKLCQQNFLSYVRMREWRDVHQQLHALVGDMGFQENSLPASYEAVHRALLAGLLSNVGTRTETFEYKASRGTRFQIFPGSGLFKKGPKWVMAAEVVETTRMYARTVAKIDAPWIEAVGGHVLKRTHTDEHWSKDAGQVAAFERGSLFGLDIYASRRVHYGPIDPAKSREIFVHHALIHAELRGPPPAFLSHNMDVIGEVRGLEARARRPDILADDSALFTFYDTRLPAGVFSISTLEQWLKRAGREAEQRLRMTRADVMRISADDVTPERFPDSVPVAGTRLNLEYRLEPGEPVDGVTMTIPVEALAQFDDARAEWLVPGMLKDKLVALMRRLPKQHRKALDPIPELAERCAASMAFGEGDLYERLSAKVKELRGVDVPRDAWQPRGIPEAFRINVAVVDEQGKALAAGRDLEEIRKKLAPRIKASFARLAGAGLERDGITTWDFGELPEKVERTRGTLRLIGYPGLVDRGVGVSIRVFESAAEAAFATRAGLRRLFAIECRDELEYQVRVVPDLPTMVLHYAAMGSAEELKRALSDAVVDRTFLRDGAPIRTKSAFDARLHEGWDRIGPAMRETGTLVAEILASRQAVAVRLGEKSPEAWAGALADIREQLAHLVPAGFLGSIPPERLGHVPRYLAAIRLRLDKLRTAGAGRDERCRGELAPHWRRWVERAGATPNGTTGVLADYRWMLEEFRVSLFAQELGTAAAVSAKRLDELWARG